jgi:SAM-dependent methyltransferase
MMDQLKVCRDISPDDGMYAGNANHYFGVGASALTNVRHAITAGNVDVRHILDFGCGAGRVTRWFNAAFPDAKIDACDVRKQDVEFVAFKWGARTWVSEMEVENISVPSEYDLIWAGSVFTHLPAAKSIALFKKMTSWLNPDGILIFTTHGRRAEHLGSQTDMYGVADDWKKICLDFRSTGYGYADYPGNDGYGISLSSPAWWMSEVANISGLRIVSAHESAWDNHQDTLAVQRWALDR